MKHVKLVLALVCATSLFFISCGDKKFKGYKSTESGLYYKFFVQADTGKLPADGDFLDLVVSYRCDSDSIPDFPASPITDVMQKSFFKGDLFEAYRMMREGDSAEFAIRADSFLVCMMGAQTLPEFITPEMYFYVTIKLNKIKTIGDLALEEQSRINDYLKEHDITTEPTQSGLYYVEQSAGKGNQILETDSVQVHYTGRVITGELFDSSVERGQPEGMKLNKLFPGLKEGITLMKEGGKATLIIPSHLAFGNGGIPNSPITPFTPLVFDVEVIKILK